MRFLWAYLLLVVVFAFGFLCAAAFTVDGDRTPPRARRAGRAR
jgi:hypothetical protein